MCDLSREVGGSQQSRLERNWAGKIQLMYKQTPKSVSAMINSRVELSSINAESCCKHSQPESSNAQRGGAVGTTKE